MGDLLFIGFVPTQLLRLGYYETTITSFSWDKHNLLHKRTTEGMYVAEFLICVVGFCVPNASGLFLGVRLVGYVLFRVFLSRNDLLWSKNLSRNFTQNFHVKSMKRVFWMFLVCGKHSSKCNLVKSNLYLTKWFYLMMWWESCLLWLQEIFGGLRCLGQDQVLSQVWISLLISLLIWLHDNCK